MSVNPFPTGRYANGEVKSQKSKVKSQRSVFVIPQSQQARTLQDLHAAAFI